MQQVSGLDELLGFSAKTQEAQNTKSSGIFSWQPDSVTFSAEALSKAYPASGGQEESGEEAASEDSLGSGGGGGASAASGTDEASIQKQITALQQQIASIQSSSLPEDAKNSTIAGLQAQISALMAQLGSAA